MTLEQQEVITFFDEAALKRPFLPDPSTMGGWGKYIKYELAVEHINRLDAGTVLDCGCNIGHVAYLHHQDEARNRDVHVVGIDISQLSLQRAVAADLDSADFAAASGLELPFADNSFELVVSIEVLEHVPDQLRYLQEIRRVLKPGGQLLLTTPNPHCWPSLWSHELNRLLLWLRGRPEADKDDFVTRKKLHQLVAAGGLTDSEQQTHILPRPFMALRGWVLTPPVPPRWALAYQMWWVRRVQLNGSRLPLLFRDRLLHTLVIFARRL